MRYALLVLILFLPIAAQAALVNINTADATLLDTLPGIGPAKAAAITNYRTQNGPFAAIEDIQNVSGIGPTTFANMKAQITVDASAGGGPTSGGQPTADAAGYKRKATAPIISTKDTTNEEGITAPAAPAQPAAAGATFPPPAAPPASHISNIFSSPWTLGLLGVIILAGGAFILL